MTREWITRILFDNLESLKMPVLDLQIWCQDDLIKFMFYEKPMVSDFVLQKWSGLPWNVKKASLAGEVARRYLNTSPDLVATGIVSGPLDKLRYKIMLSGYSHKEREIIVKEGEARYFNIVRQVERWTDHFTDHHIGIEKTELLKRK